MSGSQIRYSVYAGDRLVALLGFGASAWMLADRERFIGWNHEQRQKNLQLVVNTARFLILPWIQSKGLASKILAMAQVSFQGLAGPLRLSARDVGNLRRESSSQGDLLQGG
jgi:hypothetical protein